MRRALLALFLCQALAVPALAQMQADQMDQSQSMQQLGQPQQQQLLQNSNKGWKQADQCTAGSITAFPDHDLASLQHRDAFVDKCLADHHLPPRPHQAPGN